MGRCYISELVNDSGGGGEKGDRKGRLYYETVMKERMVIVEATLAVAFLTLTAII